MRTADQDAILDNRIAARLKQCRLDGMTDRDTAMAIRIVVELFDITIPETESDMETIKRIGHGAQRHDWPYCLGELEKARMRRANA